MLNAILYNCRTISIICEKAGLYCYPTQGYKNRRTVGRAKRICGRTTRPTGVSPVCEARSEHKQSAANDSAEL